MKTSIGRVVHYQAYGTPGGDHAKYKPEPRAAVVTAVHSDTMVSLAIFSPHGVHFDQSVHYSETPAPGCWSWPPRV